MTSNYCRHFRSTLAAGLIGLGFTAGMAGLAMAQNVNPTAVQGSDGQVPAPDKNPTPPLTFPPSSACAFHGDPACEAKLKADAKENSDFGKTGVKGGAPATSTGSAFNGSSSSGGQSLGGLSGSSSTLAPSSPDTGSRASSPNSIGNPSAGTPNPSGTGSGASGGSSGGM